MTSGHRNKQIQVYDPAVAGKQVVAQENAGQGDRNVGNKSAGRILQPSKEQYQPVVAGIAMSPAVSSRPPDMRLSSKEVASRDIGRMMEIPPLRGRDISNLSSSSTSRTSNMSSPNRSSSSRK
jgi:hypothetical protein